MGKESKQARAKGGFPVRSPRDAGDATTLSTTRKAISQPVRKKSDQPKNAT